MDQKRAVISCWRDSISEPHHQSLKVANYRAFIEKHTHLNPVGFEKYYKEISDGILLPFLRPDIYKTHGVKRPIGFLIQGPTGCGKTYLVNSLASALSLPIISITSSSASKHLKEDFDAFLKAIFQKARRDSPSLVFFDDIDSLLGRRDVSKDSDKRNSLILADWLDQLGSTNEQSKVTVIGTCKSTDALEPSLRRPGRFDKELTIVAPNTEERKSILTGLAEGFDKGRFVDWGTISNLTSGYIAADLLALTAQAVVNMTTRYCKLEFPEMRFHKLGLADSIAMMKEQICSIQLIGDTQIETADYISALPSIHASVKREGFSKSPKVKWEDIGALQNVREQLQMSVVMPIRYPNVFESVGIKSPTGVLLWGPPGCGKTLLAKAVASESSASFISVKGPEFLNKFLGESERSLRQLFHRARTSAPCVIFFDEIDAVVPRRDTASNENSSRVVNTFLSELDGIDSRSGVFLIAASNRPDVIDPALLRPGRIDKLLLVDVPNQMERADILRALSKKMPFESSIDFHKISLDKRLDGFSGADIAALLKEAATVCLKRTVFSNTVRLELPLNINEALQISGHDVELALSNCKPSINRRERDMYIKLSRLYG